MKIILDGMGGDHAPGVIIEGAIAAIRSMDHQIVLVGQEDVLTAELERQGYSGKQISVVHASQAIDCNEPPVKAVRTKKDSSIVKGLTMLKEGEGDAFLSAGSTGALLAGGLFNLGRIQGIDRPTLGTIYPVMGHAPSFLTDAGANAECKAQNLLEFGIMGSTYMEKVLGVENPTVGLINNGAEEGKGTTLTKAAYELLDKSSLNFIGNVEARELPFGAADVLVADGFTGNACLKLTEGMAMMVLRELKRRFTSSGKAKLGALMLKNQLMDIRKEFDYAEYGGAPILGVKGAMLKMHGSSNALAVQKTIEKTIPFVEQNVIGIIQSSVLEIEEIMIRE